MGVVVECFEAGAGRVKAEAHDDGVGNKAERQTVLGKDRREMR